MKLRHILALTSALAIASCQAQSQESQDSTIAPEATAATASYLQRLPEDEVVYFMLPDRFENGDPSNDTGGFEGGRLDHGFDPAHKGFFHGGDLVGLTSRLDYIQGMGVTAIWLGPIYMNKPVQGEGEWVSAGYHGYWITDFTRPDPHFGTPEELKAFIDAAHDRGIKVYLDIITNHTADVISYRECHDPSFEGYIDPQGDCPYRPVHDYPYTTLGGVNGDEINTGFLGTEDHLMTEENYSALTNPNWAYSVYVPEAEKDVKIPAWLNDPIYYHNRGDSHWVDESSLNGDFVGLDDLMTENPVVVEGMIEIFEGWITEYKIDGFRIDTARHVNDEFWRQFIPAMMEHAEQEGIPNFFIFAESAFEHDHEFLARQTQVGGFDQVLDFGMFTTLRAVLSGDDYARAFVPFFMNDDLYVKGQASTRRNPTFVSNHDMGRLSTKIRDANPDISQDELLARVTLGQELLFYLRGVPVIYAGDEQGFLSDGNDQLAREDMFPSQVDVYNDNDLLGTDATTAESNFDTDHPIYLAIQKAAEIYKTHPALTRGEQVLRLAEEEGYVLAWSRFDPETGREYLIVANMDNEERQVNIAVDPLSEGFKSLDGMCPANTNTTGNVTVNIPALEIIVCRATTLSSRTPQ